jgi:hypothetical protein
MILIGASAAFAQTSTDVIRGRVIDPDRRPIEGVGVRAVSYQGQITKTATTDKNGRYTIIFINGEGDYWLDFRKLGFAPRRFEVKKIGDEEVLFGDAQLSSSIVALDAVTVVEQKNRALPNRSSKDPDVGGGDRSLTNAGVSPDAEGNLAAMAAAAGFQLIPGLDGAPDMYSVLGLSGDQNNVTFNGLGSGISALPPDVLATTSINPYPFDVSRGGFSGAQIAIQTIPGSNFSRRSLTNVNVAPALEWADQTAAEQGQKYTNVRVGGNAAGPIALDQVFYNGAYNFARRFNDAQSLLNASPLGLAAAGVAHDSVARFLSFLNQRAIPTRIGAPSNSQFQDAFQGLVNLDIAPSASGTGNSFTVGLAGNYQRTKPVDRGGLLLSTPSHSNETAFWGAIGSVTHVNYFGFGILSKTTLGLGVQSNTANPYQEIPEGVVRIASTLPGGGSAVRSLSFGGSMTESSSSSRTIQLSNQLTWYSLDNRHTLRVMSSLTDDAFATDLGQRLSGSFTFNSLADLERGAPASFLRTLSAAKQSGRQLIGSMSVGDYWRPTETLQLQYGVRVDGNRFLTTPASNAALASTFGLRNDALPSRLYGSPRIGLQWAYGKASQIQYAPGSARPPRSVVHAGIGIFQNLAQSQFIAPALSATGLPTSARSIACVGSAVPFPKWDSFLSDPASIPSSCADGTAGTVYGSGSPNVALFDPAFHQARSLRAAADWSGPVLDNRFVLGVQGIVSSGFDQQGIVDVNARSIPSFTLASEGGRPIFADASSIVPTTGSIAAGAARISRDFQRVAVQRSDLGTRARQFAVNLKPVTAKPRLRWDVTYTWLDAREQFFGFSSTVDDPFARQWGPSLQAPKHSVAFSWRDFPIFDLVYVSAIVQASSGQRFTPMVATDINGDGASNDRAFVASANPAIATLLATGSSAARTCLERQLDHFADRGSCEAPWAIANVMQVKFNPRKIGLPKRASVVLTVANPLGLADLALHGENDTRGWGQRIPPDQNLLFVRGFDPATKQFAYDVNQRFGSTRPRESTTHLLPYLSLGVNIDLGVSRERQLLTQRLDAGRRREGTRANPEAMKNLGTSAIPNPMAMILTQQLDLHMTRAQADSLATLSRQFSVFADSVWTPVASYLSALPEGYNTGDAYARYVSARERTVDYLLTLVPTAKRILTPSQQRQLPLQISNFLDRRVLEFLRTSTLGDR